MSHHDLLPQMALAFSPSASSESRASGKTRVNQPQ
jgi:hypothetical protein